MIDVGAPTTAGSNGTLAVPTTPVDEVQVRVNDVAGSLALVATATCVVSPLGVSDVSESLLVHVNVVPAGNADPAGDGTS